MDEKQGNFAQSRAETWRLRIAAGGVVLALLVMAGIASLLGFEADLSDDLRKAELTAQDRRALILSVLSAHQDLETGARGYIITGKEEFLEPYDRGLSELAKIEPALDRAFPKAGGERTLVKSIAKNSRAKREFTLLTIAARRSGSPARAGELVAEGKGKRLMDAVRRDIVRLMLLQKEDLAVSTRQSGLAIAKQHRTSLGLLLVLALLLIATWVALQRTLASRDKALMALRDVSSRRQAILEGAMDGIIMVNPSGSIESVNPAVERMFGYTAAQLERRDVGMLIANSPPVGRVAQALKGLELSEGQPGQAQVVEVMRADGTVFPSEISISMIALTEGLRYVAVIRDVTERQRLEQMKSEFVSTVSHELRTPLTSIAGSLGLLKAQSQAMDGRAQRLVEIAHGNADRLVRLINDILDIEKMEAGGMPFAMTEVDLAGAIDTAIEAIGSYAADFDVVVVRKEDPSMTGRAIVSADRDRLGQVFDNLLSNAIKFSPRGGTVTVTLAREASNFLISVADKGAGIPDEFHGRVFEKFAQADSSDTRQRGGTGLGLSIVREIVRRLGGRVDFESALGEGTTFRVHLPEESAAPTAQSPVPRARPTLLVCGNGVGTTFTGALRSAGYGVRLVHELSELKELLREQIFDGVVVDMGLPEGAGIAMIRAVRESTRNARTQLLALGGRPGTSELDGDAALVMDWLRKPVDVRRLLKSVGATTGASGAEMPRVLHVEDDPDVVKVVHAALEGRADVVAARTLEDARTALNSSPRFDLAILDLGLADGSGTALLPDLNTVEGGPIPVVIFSAQDADPEVAGRVEAYLTKARTPISALVALVEGMVAGPNAEGPEEDART